MYDRNSCSCKESCLQSRLCFGQENGFRIPKLLLSLLKSTWSLLVKPKTEKLLKLDKNQGPNIIRRKKDLPRVFTLLLDIYEGKWWFP